jgi:glycopeptide antibiotics resistance protein
VLFYNYDFWKGGRKLKKLLSSKNLTLVLFVIYFALLAGVILFKINIPIYRAGEMRKINLIPFSIAGNETGYLSWSETAQNIIVFVPLGIYFSMLFRKKSFVRKVLLIALVSAAFEVTQFILAIGITDITDVITNTSGGVIGIVLYFLLKKILKRKAHLFINAIALFVTAAALLYIGYIHVPHGTLK